MHPSFNLDIPHWQGLLFGMGLSLIGVQVGPQTTHWQRIVSMN
jgi:hypothetical protein